MYKKISSIHGSSVLTVNEKTIEKREIIKSSGYKYVSIYECQQKNNKEFQRFVKNIYNKEIVDWEKYAIMLIAVMQTRDAVERTQPNFYTS